jgi:hypothetical protein
MMEVNMEIEVTKVDQLGNLLDKQRPVFVESKKSDCAREEERGLLRIIQKIDMSDCSFLQNFSQYLKDRINSDKYTPDHDSPMSVLYYFIESIYNLPKMPRSFMNKGCALLGETPFDKLDFTRAFLESYGASEYVNNGNTIKRYAIINCIGKTGRIRRSYTLLALLKKYKDVPFVIFNNCESLLKKDDYLVLFKHLSEYNRTVTFFTDRGDPADANFSVKSWYILLGDENKIHEAPEKEKPAFRSAVQAHIDAFLSHISVYDFNKGSRYYGHDIIPIYN